MTDRMVSDLYDEDTGEDPILELLTSAGLKASKPRFRLITVMYEAGRPLSVHELHKKVPEIEVSSIYRTMNLLLENNIVRVINIGDAGISYELVLNKNHHHHLICTNCKDIEDVSICVVDKTENDVLSHAKNFTKVTHHSLEFFGLCNRCTRKT